MKLYQRILCILMAGLALAWASGDPPEGHIEATVGGGHYNIDTYVFLSTTTALETVWGTAQKGGTDQADANTRIDYYEIYLWWDVDKDGTADGGDEPVGQDQLSGNMTDAGASTELLSAASFHTSGFALIGTELILYTGKTGNTLTGCTRGYNETTAASHTTGDVVHEVQAWKLVLAATVDGSPYNALGWDSSGTGMDDGTEGDLLQNGPTDDVTVTAGRSYLAMIRVIDSSGNSNLDDTGGTEQYVTFGNAGYWNADGANVGGVTYASGDGHEDDEILSFRINAKPRRRFP